jgi:phosphatidylglycerophosphatase C
VKKIAFFDFDGTITSKDTLLEVIKYQKGKAAFFWGFLTNAPVLAALKLKLISNQAAKEKILSHFFKGTDIAVFQQACDLFIADRLSSIIRPGAITEIKKLRALGFEVVIVSASAESWIKKWCNEIKVQLIASQLEIIDQCITGKLIGKNCHGEEKVTRIKALYDLSGYDVIYCYGDSSGDRPMLDLATRAFYKPFRQ